MNENIYQNETAHSKKTRERVKEQSNFYTLSGAIKKFRFPVTLQVIPSRQLNLFDSDEEFTTLKKQVITVIGEVSRKKIKCLTSSEEIIKERKNREIMWVVVMEAFTYGNNTFNVGEILQLKNTSKFSTLRGSRKLAVIVFSTSQEILLPGKIECEFRRCFEPNFKRPTKLLSDVVKNKTFPFIIKFPTQIDKKFGKIPTVFDISKSFVVATEVYQKDIYIACKKNKDMFQIHTVPSHIDADVEVLHGETPVKSFSPHQVNIIKSTLIYSDIDFAEQHHQKRDYADLYLDEHEEHFGDIDESIYSNPQGVIENADGYEDPDAYGRENKNEFDETSTYNPFLSNTKKLTPRISYENNSLKQMGTDETLNEVDYEVNNIAKEKEFKVVHAKDVSDLPKEAKDEQSRNCRMSELYLNLLDDKSEDVSVSTPPTNNCGYKFRPPKVKEHKKDYIDSDGYMAIKLRGCFPADSASNSSADLGHADNGTPTNASRPAVPSRLNQSSTNDNAANFYNNINSPVDETKHESVRADYDNHRQSCSKVNSAKKHTPSSSSDYDYPDMTEFSMYDLTDIKSDKSLQKETSRLKISSLGVSEVSNMLRTLSLKDKIEKFQNLGIDGHILANLTESDFIDLTLTQFQARKLYKFVNGWRPLVDENNINNPPAEYSVNNVSKLVSEMKIQTLSNFVTTQHIDGHLMCELLKDDILSTFGCDHGIMLRRYEIINLKKVFLEGNESNIC
ncbi:uncharacterized protein LOC130621664 isoform X2 [Hydractinia symbiolongicarpus]|uniref:uncharacterized protein LOC130621664 isoform X2 n=1 Tax=Hydractinia symbiolongicarpus TaxID=13093 RepID=UPI002550FD90|nr:uncharacterized protein LOC130621664 isoform X2 [Hydractinia symbiolongicarpus]